MNISLLSLTELKVALDIAYRQFQESENEEDGLFWHGRIRLLQAEGVKRVKALKFNPELEQKA